MVLGRRLGRGLLSAQLVPGMEAARTRIRLR
jgi:hypothetical protein